MKILVLNAGSSSMKYQMFDMDSQVSLCSGLVERVGSQQGGSIFHKKGDIKEVREKPFPSHYDAMQEILSIIENDNLGVISDANEIEGVGHRVVHGGTISSSEIITPAVYGEIVKAQALAPLHNPYSVVGIDVARKFFPNAGHVAVFDTAFHQTMPAEAYMYPLPYEYYEEMKVRKYGFHGTSHKYVASRAAEIMGKNPEEVNVITVHLGNGSSITAVKKGKSIDTSMGMTPLEGLMMGTRCGSIDPAIVKFIASNKNISIDDVDDIMTKKSGLLGISGNNDLRDVVGKADAGDERAALAIKMLVYRIRHFLGAYLLNMGEKTDAIVFTAGIGENSALVREETLKGLGYLGIKLDHRKNGEKYGEYIEISEEGNPVRVFAIRTNEELEIARQTEKLLGGLSGRDEAMTQ